MSKIELPSVTGSSNLSRINDNFKKVEDALNQEVLYRTRYPGEPNEMESDLDMNGKRILNTVPATTDSEPVQLGQVMDIIDKALGNGSSVAPSFIGYIYLGLYGAGIQLTSYKDMVTYNGVEYVNEGPFPKTTTGDFQSDGPWVALSSSTSIFMYEFTAFAGQTQYTITSPVVSGTVPLVFKRGVYQQNGIAYTVSPSDGKTFIFSEPLSLGDSVQILAMSGADAVQKGDYKDFIYANSATQPTTPSGNSPAGWTSAPQTPTSGQSTYVSTAYRKSSDNSLIGDWSIPSKLSGPTGQQGASVQQVELVSKVGKVATYRFQLTDLTYTNTFLVYDGVDGSGSVSTVNGVNPDVSGNVQLTATNVGAEAAWVNDTANTGTLNTSNRVRWLVDTSAARNRTIGASVTDLVVKDVTGQAGTNNITITAPSGKTINGASTETVDANYGWVQYTLVGTDFKTVGGQ